MAIESVRIPQIGEGLQEARLVAVLKQPGEFIKRDEPIYQMETDKAVMDVESPYEGTLIEWLAEVDSILPIGAEVAKMQTSGAVPTAPVATKSPGVPPRTRAYAKEKGIGEADLARLAEKPGKLMPEDIDLYLAAPRAPRAEGKFTEHSMSGKQRVLNSRMQRGTQLVVPGTISIVVEWGGIESQKARLKAEGGAFQPSAFTMLAFAVARAVQSFPLLRTSLVGDETYRTYHTLSMGIAVSLPGDELVLAVVDDADQLAWRDFAAKAWEAIKRGRSGKDQASEAVTLSITNMQNFGLRDAIPVVVPPACATLFVGEVYSEIVELEGAFRSRNVVNLALTFDHRVMNGVGAANFMKAVKSNLEGIEDLLG